MSYEFSTTEYTESHGVFILLRPQAMKELCGTLCTLWCNSLVASRYCGESFNTAKIQPQKRLVKSFGIFFRDCSRLFGRIYRTYRWERSTLGGGAHHPSDRPDTSSQRRFLSNMKPVCTIREDDAFFGSFRCRRFGR